MYRDPVYAEFVLPEWRETELHAASETRRADAEAQARREAEQALAQLRAQLAGRPPEG